MSHADEIDDEATAEAVYQAGLKKDAKKKKLAAVVDDEADALPPSTVDTGDTPPPSDPPPARLDYSRPVLLEGADGAGPMDGPIVVQHQERKFTHAGVHYEHVSEHADGRWIYREMP